MESSSNVQLRLPLEYRPILLAIGNEVLVWRENKGWNGPYKLLLIDGRNCTIQLPSGPTQFRITSIKRYYRSDHTELPIVAPATIPAIAPTTVPTIDLPHDDQRPNSKSAEPPTRPIRNRQLPVRYREVDQANELQEESYLTTKEDENIKLAIKLRAEGVIRSVNGPFVHSRKKELDGLIGQQVFQVVDITDVPKGERLFGSRFVDDIKRNTEGIPYEKLRLVVQAHHDQGKKDVLTQSPTIQRVSQRLILCLAMVFDNRDLYLRDISQAYVQSSTNLARRFYIKPPKEVDLGGNVLKVLRPLYGVPEAGTHWYNTYHKHHTEKLGLNPSSYDPCLLYNQEAIVGLQTDDTFYLATIKYAEQEQVELEKAGYLAKTVKKLIDKLTFNGGDITRFDDRIGLTQERQCAKINLIDAKSDFKGAYIRERARGAYIASTCQPEAAFTLSYAAQTTVPDEEDVQRLNSRLKWQQENRLRGLRYVKLLPEGLKLLVFVDASFANNKDMSSQIGYVIVLANERKYDDSKVAIKGNIIHWSSTKCKRVTRSVLASELYAMVAGFDMGSVIKTTVNSILATTQIPLIICTDSYSLYDCMIKLGTTAEKRLMIDIMGLRQSYERREISEVRWIEGTSNPADAMTKEKPGGALRHLLDKNQLEIVTKAWVERESTT